MAFELRELSGVAFLETEKRSEKAPDWKGKCLVNGVPHELAMWERDGKRGKFLSFKIGPARERRGDGFEQFGRVASDEIEPF